MSIDMHQQPEGPTLNEKVSTGIYANHLRIRRLKRPIEVYEERGRHAEAMIARERLRRAEMVEQVADSIFYSDLGQA